MTHLARRFAGLLALVPLASLALGGLAHGVDLLTENFEGLTLNPIVTFESEIRSRAAWTKSVPSGAGVEGVWSIDDTAMSAATGDPLVGAAEFEGWTFVDKEWWINTAGDQDRVQFVSASGKVAVADPDEWDDYGNVDPETLGPYDTTLRISSIPLQGVAPNTAKLFFHSSWRPEDNQKASLTVKYNDSAATSIELFRWTSSDGDPNFKPDATNEAINLNLLNPAGATQATLEFRLFDAGNDWWWAIDNLYMFTGANPGQDGVLRLIVDRDTQQVKIVNNTSGAVNLRGYSVRSNLGTLDEAAATYLGESNTNWQILDNPTISELSEGYIPDQYVMPTAASNPSLGQINLGAAWRKYHSDISDVTFQYLVAGSATPMTGIVEFTGNGGVSYHPLDLNFDGEINLADYGVFLAGYATPLAGKTAAQQYNLGDLDRDGKHTIRDYAQFRQQFNLARGPGAFEAALAQGFAVPEPTTLLMLIMAALLPATRRRRALPAAVPLMIAGLAAVPSADGAPLNETFEGVQLVASIEETPTPGVWSDIGPRGWRIDRTGVPGFSQQPTNNGVREWIGWNFAKKDWWVAAAGDQDRSMFLKGTGTILVADPDEWDDEAHPDDSYYSTYITTPRLDVLSGIAAGQLTLTFDSSWLPEGFDDWALPGQSGPTNNQTATIDVSYNGGPYQNVLTWDSQTGSPTFKAGALDETVNVNLGYDGAPNTSLQIRFGLLNAANDWWWALDNIRVNNVDVVVPVSPTLRINTTTGTAQIVGGGNIIPEAVNGYDISSANGNLAPQGNVGLSFTKPDSIDGPDPDTTVGSNIGESWQLASSTANLFSEFFLDGSSPYLASRTDSLGRIFNPSTPEANRDVLFTYTTIDGEILSGGVEYVSTPANADFDSDGDVDGADFLRWQRNKGTGTTLAQGNADGDGDVDADDLAIWKLKFGLPPATPTTAAVPEPQGVALASLALGVLAGLRRRLAGARRAVLAQGAVAAAAAAVAAGVAQAQSVPAPFVDRNYRMGDVEPGAADGADVNVTWDSAGQPNMNQLIDLTAFTKAGAKPKYIAITGRPDGGTGRGINLNPLATDRQFLRTAADEALNVPEKSPSSMDGILPGGTLDYSYIIDRGFQLWTRPSAVGTLGHIVMDTNNHGVMLRADGKFAMRYNNADYVGSTTATANTWYHLMVVRPFGPGNGSILYVNGVAEAAAVGNYQGEDVPNDEVAPGNQDNSPLVIGANTAESAFQLASTAFYRGIVDDLEMFVMGVNPTSDRGEFKFDRDNKYAAHFKPTNIADLTGDNAITMADVTVFANNWLKEKVLTWTQAGVPRALAVGDLQSRAMGDFNYDGRVNLADWGILNTANPAMGAAALALIGSVPEPSTLVLAAACGGLLVSAARRIRRGAL